MNTEGARSLSERKAASFGVPLLKDIARDPLGVAQRLQAEHGDVVGLRILLSRVYYFFRPEAARQILVDLHDKFVKEERQLRIFRSVQGVNVLTTEGRTWERQRRILMPGFMPKRIACYVELMAAATDDGIQADLPVQSGQSSLIDVDRFTTRLTMDVILRTLFAHKATREESDAISDAIRSITRQNMRELFWLVMPPNWLPYPGRKSKLKKRAIIHELVAAQIRARRSILPRSTNTAADREDLLGMLLAARDDQILGPSMEGSLSDQEIHDNCLVMFVAGHDTSASALTWWIGLMATHPWVADEVRAELKAAGEAPSDTPETLSRLTLLNATLKEAMRLYPPATATFSRTARRHVRVGDVEVPKGSVVVLPIWNIHHDERWFPEPEKFKPERFMPGAPSIPRGAYMPFAAGPHFCLGQHFATIEMALIAVKLLRQYNWSLEPGQALPEAVVDLVLKPKTRLQVHFTRR